MKGYFVLAILILAVTAASVTMFRRQLFYMIPDGEFKMSVYFWLHRSNLEKVFDGFEEGSWEHYGVFVNPEQYGMEKIETVQAVQSDTVPTYDELQYLKMVEATAYDMDQVDDALEAALARSWLYWVFAGTRTEGWTLDIPIELCDRGDYCWLQLLRSNDSAQLSGCQDLQYDNGSSASLCYELIDEPWYWIKYKMPYADTWAEL